MDAMISGVVFFWLPMSLIAVGLWISLSSKEDFKTNIGKFIAAISFVLVCISPWTAPTSPSSAIGHLIGFIAGPSVLLLLGLYLLIFSGNVAIGKLPSSDKKLGILSITIGIIWFLMMQWGDFTPMYNGNEVNRFWLIFFPTMLIMLCSLSSVFSMSMLIVGNERQKESRTMLLISILSLFLIICAMTIDGQNVTAETFRIYFWLSVSDLLGILVGISLSLLIFGCVIYFYESSIGDPKSVPPPTEKELSLASEKISQNIGGVESE